MLYDLLTNGLSLSEPLLIPSKDNCARAVTGTRPGKDVLAQKSDCSSFMLATVTPATATITQTLRVTPSTDTIYAATTTIISFVTATEVVTVTSFTGIERRDVPTGGPVTTSPTNIPTYASACDNVLRYSSACSCWGITATTTTAATPSTTVTVTISETAMVTATLSATITSVTTTTSTTTILGLRPSCEPGVTPGGGSCNCRHTVYCDTGYPALSIPYQTTTQNNLYDCLLVCDNSFPCNFIRFVHSTGACSLYNSSPGQRVPAPGISVAQVIFESSCGPTCTGRLARVGSTTEGEAKSLPIG
jgi:hypothetical protein